MRWQHAICIVLDERWGVVILMPQASVCWTKEVLVVGHCGAEAQWTFQCIYSCHAVHRYPSPSTRMQSNVSNACGPPASTSSLWGKNLIRSEHNSAFEQKQKPLTGFYLFIYWHWLFLWVALGSNSWGASSIASLTFLVYACNGVMTIASDVPCLFPGLSLSCLSSGFPWSNHGFAF